MKSRLLLLAAGLALILVACGAAPSLTENSITATPPAQPTAETVTPTPAKQHPTDTLPAQPTAQPTTQATHTASPLPTAQPTAESTALPPVPIVYYYFVAVESNTYPAGSVVILPDILILGPALSEISRSTDAVTNIGNALQSMLDDPRNAWTSTNLSIASITLDQGAASVALEGEYFAPGDIVLVAAREQIMLTVFTEAAVQTVTITLNGKNIVNLGISNISQAQPEDYVFTRDEIDAFLAENAYPAP
jgi:hypothetical protein